HTRFSRDWSSDVCSSDLLRVCALDGHPAVGTLKNRGLKKTVAVKLCLRLLACAEQLSSTRPEIPPDNDDQQRSDQQHRSQKQQQWQYDRRMVLSRSRRAAAVHGD